MTLILPLWVLNKQHLEAGAAAATSSIKESRIRPTTTGRTAGKSPLDLVLLHASSVQLTAKLHFQTQRGQFGRSKQK